MTRKQYQEWIRRSEEIWQELDAKRREVKSIRRELGDENEVLRHDVEALEQENQRLNKELSKALEIPLLRDGKASDRKTWQTVAVENQAAADRWAAKYEELYEKIQVLEGKWRPRESKSAEESRHPEAGPEQERAFNTGILRMVSEGRLR